MRRCSRLRWKQAGGFSLLELMVVVVMVAIIIPALLSGFTVSYLTVRETRMLEVAKHIGQTIIERAVTYTIEEEGVVPSPVPGYHCTVAFPWDHDLGRELVVVVVSYSFLGVDKEYRTVAVRYDDTQ